jgi:putative membrane protein
LPALVLAAVTVALVAATARAGDGKGHHGDRNRDARHAQKQNDTQQTATSDAICGLDEVWLKTSIEGDRYEIVSGTVALQKSSNAAVRKLAETVVKDHTQSLQEAIDLATKLGIEVPTEPSPTQQWQIEELREFTGAEFDHDYAELEVADHIQDIDEAKDEVELGCNSEVREDAAKEIPVLEYHLSLAKAAYASASQEDSSH